MITDKVYTQNGADFTFVCGKVPFAISCSEDLPHKNFNMIDLDLVNKMKIPLKNIRVTRMTIQGHDLRCVGVVSQTIQCVADGKISGTIHLYAKVVRDLYSSISTDCLASRRTFSRLMGHDPAEEPPDNPNIEVLGGDDDNKEEDADVRAPDAEEEDVRVPDAEEDDVRVPDAEEVDVRVLDAEEENVRVPEAKGESDDKDVHISSTTPCQPDPCYDSDGNYDELLTRFVNGEFPDYDYYEKGALFKIPKKGRRKTTTQASHVEKHCQFCFLSGQPIKVTVSHNDMDIECPSMSDVDRVRIHGEEKTNKWLARMYGYND